MPFANSKQCSPPPSVNDSLKQPFKENCSLKNVVKSLGILISIPLIVNKNRQNANIVTLLTHTHSEIVSSSLPYRF